jgi:signal peptidase II
VNILGEPRVRLAVLVAVAVVIADQVTKMVVEHTLAPARTIPLTPFFALTYVRNTGAAFGVLGGVPAAVRLPVFLGVTVLALWALVSFLRKASPDQRWLVGAIGAVLGGAIGNLICRLRYGEVIDFLDLHWRGWHWPAFNVADSAITVGVLIVLLASRPETSSESAARRESRAR